MRSLNARLALSLTISLATFFIIQSIMVGFEVQRMNEQSLISRLEHEMEDILASLAVSNDKLVVDWERVPSIYRRPFSGHYFQLVSDNDKPLRSRSLWDENLPVSDVGILSDLKGPTGQSLLVLSKRFVVHGKAVLLSVAEDTSRQKASSLLFQRRLLLLSFTALLLLLVMQIWVIRRGLKPLTGLKDELGRLERGETEVLQQQVPAEIAPLVDEINRLLSVLRQRLVRSRNSMGNLAHALKTPLTRMLQLLEHEPAKEDRQIIIELVRNIEQRVERELSRARMAGQTPGGFWPEPARDIRDLATTLEAINQKRTIIDLDIQDGLHIAADREDMMELIGNLLDNACKWARHRIRLRLSVEEGLCITIEDDGPGMDKAEQYEALNRGVRADESKPGHGLGLAIVRDIIAVYKGTLHMGSSNSLGGLRISIFLPDSAANVKQKS